jgi:hypothetical protein
MEAHDRKVAKMKEHNVNTQVALLKQSIGHVNETLKRIELGFTSHLDDISRRLDKLDNRLWQIIFLIASSVIGLVIAKIFHWF